MKSVDEMLPLFLDDEMELEIQLMHDILGMTDDFEDDDDYIEPDGFESIADDIFLDLDEDVDELVPLKPYSIDLTEEN